MGVAGAEYGHRGYLAGYDAASGKEVWRTWAVPAPGESGSETWPSNGTWKTGGGSTWLTGSYDPDLDLVFWGTVDLIHKAAVPVSIQSTPSARPVSRLPPAIPLSN